ncbi:hypothetical protein K0U83_16725, partial [bacterium]|nr:hypothetical protein [bacterium]
MEEWMYNPYQSFGLGSSAYDLGGSGNNYNTVSYTPSYGGTGDYNVGGSGGSGGDYNTVSYMPSYGSTGDYNVGGSGGSGGGYNTVSYTPSYNPGAYGNYGGDNSAPYWEAPSLAPSFAPSFAPTFTLQQGVGASPYDLSAPQNYGGTATMNLGSGTPTVGGQTFTGANTTVAPAASSSVGGLGVTPLKYQLGNTQPALLESAATTGA